MPDKKIEVTGQIRHELKELTSSISRMMEIFRQIKRPIQESFETVPTTAQHLEKVNEQTEQAANKVLDMVESINSREAHITEGIKKINECIPADVLKKSPDLAKTLHEIAAAAEANLNDSFSIMDAMQFQDITSQQMNHAITLLDDVEDKLVSLLDTVGLKIENSQIKTVKKKRVYDPNAKFTLDDPKKQKEIDEIISGID
jgi:chemotaxis regulatin CheY-phosphate phosphatase CheZ